ncbi:hypothetical protein BOTCAL_0216g00150 [Botryotinia calthae]|uniref:Uncharacterized protein n=1 Tax=Botryotinia calthae TaxID=38488 RepID=A0A4Y8CYG8_9HELO|nr:hypothetical protein BOTCAL_0216g00150 [Botryotinia calthae]
MMLRIFVRAIDQSKYLKSYYRTPDAQNLKLGRDRALLDVFILGSAHRNYWHVEADLHKLVNYWEDYRMWKPGLGIFQT